MESYCSLCTFKVPQGANNLILCTLDTTSIHRLFFVTRLIINQINQVHWVDFKLENVLVSLHSLKTMGLGPFGTSAPLFLRNGELLGHSPIHNSLITACDLCFFTVIFCSFNTLIYPSKKYNIDKGDESGIVNIFNMFLKVQCRYKHMAWTTLLHLVHIVLALERMLGVVQRIQFRCFLFPNVQVYFCCLDKLTDVPW